MDYWLMQFDRNLKPLKNNEILLPVYKEPIGDSIGVSDFVPIKVIGKGGFS